MYVAINRKKRPLFFFLQKGSLFLHFYPPISLISLSEYIVTAWHAIESVKIQ